MTSNQNMLHGDGKISLKVRTLQFEASQLEFIWRELYLTKLQKSQLENLGTILM